jgi:DNA uptake protein ComE-like DNA-binding protein
MKYRVRVKPGLRHGGPEHGYEGGEELVVDAGAYRAFGDKFELIEKIDDAEEEEVETAVTEEEPEAETAVVEETEDDVEFIVNPAPSPALAEAVKGIGKKTAEALANAGVETVADAKAAADDELLAVDGVGAATLADIREVAPHSE